MKIKYYQQKKKTKSRLAQRNEKFPQYTNDNDEIPEDQSESDDASHEPFFNRFKVNSFVISATSALSENGLFANKNGINIIFLILILNRKMNYYYMEVLRPSKLYDLKMIIHMRFFILINPKVLHHLRHHIPVLMMWLARHRHYLHQQVVPLRKLTFVLKFSRNLKSLMI